VAATTKGDGARGGGGEGAGAANCGGGGSHWGQGEAGRRGWRGRRSA
jgi:hypothetical protein